MAKKAVTLTIHMGRCSGSKTEVELFPDPTKVIGDWSPAVLVLLSLDDERPTLFSREADDLSEATRSRHHVGYG